MGRAVLDRETIHVYGLLAVMGTEYPAPRPFTSTRTILVTPLLSKETTIRVFLGSGGVCGVKQAPLHCRSVA